MKKTFAIFICIILIFSACTKAENKPVIDDTPKVTENSPKEEIIEHNKEIDASTINLIQFLPPTDDQVKATIKTSDGDIDIVLYPTQAPHAVEAFINNAQSGVYSGSTFYDVVENFYIQTTAKDSPAIKKLSTTAESSVPSNGIEQSLDLWHFRGALSMRDNLTDNPSSDLSTFFIVQAVLLPEDLFEKMEATGYPAQVIEQYKKTGGIPGYDTHHTVFGQVTNGMDIVDKITNVRVDKDHYPEDPVIIESITVDTSNYKQDAAA